MMEPISFSTPEPTTELVTPEVVDSVGKEYRAHTPLYERFSILDKDSPRVNRNLELIWNWARDHAETPDKDSILWQITKLTHRIGDAPYGSAPYTKVLNYVTEYNRMLQAEKRLKELEGHVRA